MNVLKAIIGALRDALVRLHEFAIDDSLYRRLIRRWSNKPKDGGVVEQDTAALLRDWRRQVSGGVYADGVFEEGDDGTTLVLFGQKTLAATHAAIDEENTDVDEGKVQIAFSWLPDLVTTLKEDEETVEETDDPGDDVHGIDENGNLII